MTRLKEAVPMDAVTFLRFVQFQHWQEGKHLTRCQLANPMLPAIDIFGIVVGLGSQWD